MTLNEFYDALKRHDWYYMYSDDGSVSRRGWDNHQVLTRTAKESVEHQAMFDGFKAHYTSGIGFGNEQSPLPVRPERTEA